MSSKNKLEKFCNLSKYINQVDPELFTCYDKLCLTGLLKPDFKSGPDAGVTFLFPKEKSYRQKIINSTFSSSPEQAISMLKSLIIPEHLSSTAAFNGTVVNLLNQKLDIEEASEKHVKLKGDIELKLDTQYKPLGNRNNVAVYNMSGKGEIPINGEVTVVERKVTKRGGSVSIKNQLYKAIESDYIENINKNVTNSYVKKCYLQLKYIYKQNGGGGHGGVDPNDYVPFLGNDEISDSYLLDRLCDISYPNVYAEILKIFNSTNSQDVSQLANITKPMYIDLKEQHFCFPDNTTKDPKRTANIKSPVELRERIYKYYRKDSERIAKDLFIVFCNIYKDLWMNDVDRIGMYKDFVYLASYVFNDYNKILDHPFDMAREFTLFGNLLKSDVFLYQPHGVFKTNLPVPDKFPNPLEMALFSLCSYTNKTKVSGGSEKHSYLFD
jgi:hypothetical protein